MYTSGDGVATTRVPGATRAGAPARSPGWSTSPERSISPVMRAGHGLGLTVVALCCAALAIGCEDDDEGQAGPAASASRAPGQLTAEMASRVLAKVGDRTITLGDYAEALRRMDRFERLRYQTADRRKRLLDEMIDVELLAREAERRGLDKLPETQMLRRQILRDELLRELRSDLPALSELPESKVRSYYDEHRDEFREPERRRVAAVVLGSRTAAERLLSRARQASAADWGKLVERYSVESGRPGDAPRPPPELAGDLGIVTHPKEGATDAVSQRVPDAVRAAVFEIGKPGEVLDRVVEADGRFFIVRLVSRMPARDRSFAEAERTIRVHLLRDEMRRAEAALERELRKKYPVKVDDEALARIEVPIVDRSEAPPSSPTSAGGAK